MNRFVSKAIDDDVVTDEEYGLVLSEYNKFIQKEDRSQSAHGQRTLIDRFKEKMRSKLRQFFCHVIKKCRS